MQPTSNRQLKIEKAFTLIELLVVIAIVGILAGLAVVNMSGATEAARIAKLKVYSSSLRSSLLSSLVSEWRLDEESGLPQDSWGKNHFISNTAVSTTSGCVDKNCLSFNGTSNQSSINDSDDLRPGEEITVESWFKLNNLSGTQSIISKDTPGPTNYWMDVRASGAQICVGGYTSAGAACYNCSSIAVSANQWHHIAFSYNRQKMKIFFDGAERSSLDLACVLNASAAPLRFGTRDGSGSFINGYMDTVRIYNKALILSEIKENYLAGLAERFAKSDEYDLQKGNR